MKAAIEGRRGQSNAWGVYDPRRWWATENPPPASWLPDPGVRGLGAIHPSAIRGWVSGWGDGVLCAGVAIFTNMKLGRPMHVNPNATIGHDSRPSDFVSVNPAAIISGGVSIEAETLIGASATTLQQWSVGAHTVVGAGSVVTKHWPSGIVVMGVPGVWQ